MSVREQIQAYVKELAGVADVPGSVDLFEMGYLSSLDVLDLLSFIESTFGVSLDGEDVSTDNLGSIDAIVSYLERPRQPL